MVAHGVRLADVEEWRRAAEKRLIAELTGAERAQLATALRPGSRVRADLDAFLGGPS